jgi:hypothetical protein
VIVTVGEIFWSYNYRKYYMVLWIYTKNEAGVAKKEIRGGMLTYRMKVLTRLLLEGARYLGVDNDCSLLFEVDDSLVNLALELDRRFGPNEKIWRDALKIYTETKSKEKMVDFLKAKLVEVKLAN